MSGRDALFNPPFIRAVRAPNRARRKLRLRTMQKDERRWKNVGEYRRLRFGNSILAQIAAGGAADGAQSRSRPADHRDRNASRRLAPAPPEMELAQIVGAHDPDETDARRAASQIGDRIGGIAGADFGLEAGHGEPRIVRQSPRRRHAFSKARQPIVLFQRIAGRDEPPDAIETQALQRVERDDQMPLVWRIKRAAEEADPLTGAPMREVGDHEGDAPARKRQRRALRSMCEAQRPRAEIWRNFIANPKAEVSIADFASERRGVPAPARPCLGPRTLQPAFRPYRVRPDRSR